MTLLLLAAAAVAFLIARAAFGPAGIVLWATVIAAGYGYSLWRNETSDCPRCSGRGRHKGILARKSGHRCSRCEGSPGQVIRLGVRVLRPGRARELVPSERRDRWWRG